MSTERSDTDAVRRARELIARGAYAEAERLLVGVIRDVESRFGAETRELLEPLYRYAQAVSKQHPWDVLPLREREALERALNIAVRVHGDESKQATRIRETLAHSLMAAKEPGAAADHMRLVVRVQERNLSKGYSLAHALNGLAAMLDSAGKHAEAAATYEQAFEMAGGQGNELMDFEMVFGRGRALVGDRRYTDALPLLEHALRHCLDKYGESHRATVEVREWLDRARRGPSEDTLT